MAETLRPQPPVSYRWAVLIFVSVAMGGNYYIYDSINPLERIFIDHLGFSATQFGWLNASYSVAAVLTLLIGGIIIDRIGTKKAITVFAALCLLGAVLTAAEGEAPLMIAGRTVLGLGAESMIVAVTTALAKWFRGKELSFAFGINLTISRLGTGSATGTAVRSSPRGARPSRGISAMPSPLGKSWPVSCTVRSRATRVRALDDDRGHAVGGDAV